MLDLTIAARESGAPSPPAISDPAATVWRDDTGIVVALGQTVNGRHWVHLTGVGAFNFPPQAGGVTAIPDEGSDRALVEDAFRRMILPLALQAQGREVLHASAVKTAAGVIAVCARSGTGKSTIACGLRQRRHPLWADDAVCFETSQERVDALPLPFSLRLRPASAAFFDGAEVEAGLLWPSERERLAAVFVLERAEAGGPRIERLSGASRFSEVLAHGYCFSMQDRDRNAAMVNNYLELVDRVAVFRVTFSEGLDRLDEILDLIEAAA